MGSVEDPVSKRDVKAASTSVFIKDVAVAWNPTKGNCSLREFVEFQE